MAVASTTHSSATYRCVVNCLRGADVVWFRFFPRSLPIGSFGSDTSIFMSRHLISTYFSTPTVSIVKFDGFYSCRVKQILSNIIEVLV